MAARQIAGDLGRSATSPPAKKIVSDRKGYPHSSSFELSRELASYPPAARSEHGATQQVQETAAHLGFDLLRIVAADGGDRPVHLSGSDA